MRICPACGSGRCDDDWRCADCGNEPARVGGVPAFAPELAAENAGFRADYFAELAAVEGRSFWFHARNELIVWALRRYVPAFRDFLEIGCGTGFVLSGIHAAYPAAALSGSEIFQAGLEFAASRVPSADIYQMDARHIPFRDHFDAIGAFDVIEHIEDDRAVLAEAARALRPGGALLLTVPQHPALWSPQDEHAYHVRRYTSTDLRRKVEAAGFEIARMTSFVSLLLPLLFASRVRLRARRPAAGEAFDAIDAVRAPGRLNGALGAVMAVERAAIRAGLSFPAGGSLLLVARRRAGSEGPA
jgi:SAM-dependent methyltransferase